LEEEAMDQKNMTMAFVIAAQIQSGFEKSFRVPVSL
jgi:hypothetical protein